MYKHKRYGGIRRILSPLYFVYEKAPTEFSSISAVLLNCKSKGTAEAITVHSGYLAGVAFSCYSTH